MWHKIITLKNCLTLPHVVHSRPPSLNVEIGNACNLDCLMCERSTYFKQSASIDLDRFCEIYAQVGSPFVALHGYGEPLLHKELVPILRYLEQQGARTSITSNLIPLTQKGAEPLIRSGLGLLKVSMDSHVRETYKKIRGEKHCCLCLISEFFFKVIWNREISR